MTSGLEVRNPPADEYFVGHVVSSSHDVQASEDIVAANGMKLLAKGARVEQGTRERLLAHKLAKPLEQCIEVTDAVNGEQLSSIATKLLDEQPLLRALHGEGKGRPVVAELVKLSLTVQLRSLLSLYAELRAGRANLNTA